VLRAWLCNWGRNKLELATCINICFFIYVSCLFGALIFLLLIGTEKSYVCILKISYSRETSICVDIVYPSMN